MQNLLSAFNVVTSKLLWIFASLVLLSVSAGFISISRRQQQFQVECVITGGRPISVFVSGPRDFMVDLSNRTETVGTSQTFAARTDVVTGGRDGDVYRCTTDNGASDASTDSIELRGN